MSSKDEPEGEVLDVASGLMISRGLGGQSTYPRSPGPLSSPGSVKAEASLFCPESKETAIGISPSLSRPCVSAASRSTIDWIDKAWNIACRSIR
jgi:hypothetical protein